MLKTLVVSIAILANVMVKGAPKSASYNASIYIYSVKTDSSSEQDCSQPHEVLCECMEAREAPMYCEELGMPTPRTDSADCTTGCVCEDGYVWDMDGNCIESTECPCCGEDPNAISGCGMKYSERCPNSAEYESPYCSDDCETNSCMCREDYVYDSNTGMCVLPDECSATCEENEEYSTCANQLCPSEDCSLYGESSSSCSLDEYDPDNCEGGCVCQDEYLRNDEGMCVPREDCSASTCPENEEYSTCANQLCPSEDCSLYEESSSCSLDEYDPDNCEGGCVCQDEYLRNDEGMCVPQEDCPEA